MSHDEGWKQFSDRLVRAVDSLTGTELTSEFLDGYTTLLVPEFTLFATIGVERCKE